MTSAAGAELADGYDRGIGEVADGPVVSSGRPCLDIPRAARYSGCQDDEGRHRAYHVPVTASRDELIHLIESMPEDQVETLLADARRLTAAKRRATWPPSFVGMIKDGPANGSTPEYIDGALAQGFGSERA